MKWIESSEVTTIIKSDGVAGIEKRDVFNTTFNCIWNMEGLVLNDGSFIGIYSEGDALSYLFFEEGK